MKAILTQMTPQYYHLEMKMSSSIFSLAGTQMLGKYHRRVGKKIKMKKRSATCPQFQMSPLANAESKL